MEKLSEDEMCNRFFSQTCISEDYREAMEWGQNRFRQLELENENLSKTVLVLCKSSIVPAGAIEEEIHQRRRREQMLDQVTLICVRDGIERMEVDATAEQTWGRSSRYSAENICHGINDYDAKI